jgi:hypothetical protein
MKADSTSTESCTDAKPDDDIRNIWFSLKAKQGLGNENKISNGRTMNPKAQKEPLLSFTSRQKVT